MNLTIKDASRLRGLLIRITMAGDIEIAPDATPTDDLAPVAPEPPVPSATDGPPDGVCVARAVDAMAEGKLGRDVRCPVHGVEPGEPCPDQSSEPADFPSMSPAPTLPNATPVAIEVGQFRADSINPTAAAIEIVAHHPESDIAPWDVRILSTDARSSLSSEDVLLFWPTLAVKPDGAVVSLAPARPDYYSVGQTWAASYAEDAATALIVKHDSNPPENVWGIQWGTRDTVRDVSPDWIDEMVSKSELAERWPVFIGWAEPAMPKPTAAQKNDSDELPRLT